MLLVFTQSFAVCLQPELCCLSSTSCAACTAMLLVFNQRCGAYLLQSYAACLQPGLCCLSSARAVLLVFNHSYAGCLQQGLCCLLSSMPNAVRCCWAWINLVAAHEQVVCRPQQQQTDLTRTSALECANGSGTSQTLGPAPTSAVCYNLGHLKPGRCSC